jgi:hypothetical protein
LEADRRLVRFEIVGDFTLGEIFDNIGAALTHPEHRPGFDVLSDHIQIGRPITTAELEQVISHLATHAERLRGSHWAIVTRRPASYGMMRMLSAHAARIPLDVEVFQTLAEADEWLKSSRPG